MTALMQWLDRETIDAIGLAVAVLGTVLLAWELWLHRRGRPRTLRRVRDGALLAAALASGLFWWHGLLLRGEPSASGLPWAHLHDAFHYYVGPKYFRELGYLHLYECAALAEQQLGAGASVVRRTYRDLATNETLSGRKLLREARSCRERFTPERWQLFVHDVDWFRQRVPIWEITMQDWGYNATPAWNALGSLLAGDAPVSERQLAWLTLLDLPVLLVTFALIAWAFGWRTMCVALIFWGNHLPNESTWVAGGILRQAWLLASVAGVCLLRKQKPLAAGAAIASAALLSIFPGFLAAGIGARAAAGWVAQRRVRLAPEHLRLLLGAGLALAIVLPASLPSGGSLAAWRGFVSNSRIDSQPMLNNMGLPALLSYDVDQRLRLFQLGEAVRPAAAWSEARQRTLRARAPIWLALMGAYLWAAFGAARRQPDWVAALLGLGFVVFAFQLSCYYYAFMLLFGLLWPRHRSIGIALCAVAVASHWIQGRWPDEEEQYVWSSLAAVAFVAWFAGIARFADDGVARFAGGEGAGHAKPREA